MTRTGKIQDHGQVTIPPVIRRQAGLSKGDSVSFEFHRGKIILTPTTPVGREQEPTADEHTPEQRKFIDARIKEARKGPYYGPFESAEEMIAHMKGQLRKRAAARKAAPRRAR